MEKHYELVFDDVMVKQLKKVARNKQIKKILSKMLDKLELTGPYAGNLLDSQLFIYEIKNKRPPVRLYYKHDLTTGELYVFEFEMKTSEKKQKETIGKIKSRLRNLNPFGQIFLQKYFFQILKGVCIPLNA